MPSTWMHYARESAIMEGSYWDAYQASVDWEEAPLTGWQTTAIPESILMQRRRELIRTTIPDKPCSTNTDIV